MLIGDGLQDVDDPGGNNELNLWRPGYLTDRQGVYVCVPAYLIKTFPVNFLYHPLITYHCIYFWIVRSYNLLIRKNRHKTTTTSLLSPEAVRDDEQVSMTLLI